MTTTITLTQGQWRCWHSSHKLTGSTVGFAWCDHIQRFISKAEDAADYTPGQTLVVPIVPSCGVYAEVLLGNSDEFGGAQFMTLRYTDDFGKVTNIDLGFWNPGEGMAAIRGVILDFIKSRVDPDESHAQHEKLRTKCPNKAHSLKASRIVMEKEHDAAWRWACLWSIVMEGACIPCVEASAGPVKSNFGVDPSIL